MHVGSEIDRVVREGVRDAIQRLPPSHDRVSYPPSTPTPRCSMTARSAYLLGLVALVVAGLVLTVLYLRTVIADREGENVTGITPT